MKFVPVLRFIALSDVHYKDYPSPERDRMENAIRLGYELSGLNTEYGKLDALYVVGDFTNRGTRVQMQAFMDTLGFIRPETEVNLSLASHEFGLGEETALKLFDEIFKQPPDTHKVINGFHFISLTTTNGCNFSEEKLAWAKRELDIAAADSPIKPIFFFQHPHISSTVYGSINWGDDALYPLLMNYPQVIDFSGHSHAPINDPRSVHQKHFTCFGTGSLSYFELDEFDKYYGTCPDRKSECAQMLIVEADKYGRVRVYPYDILTENFFPFVWEIDEPWKPESFKYTDKRYKTDAAPYFIGNPSIKAAFDSEILTVSFPQAFMDGEYVNSYDVTVKEPLTGVTVAKKSFWSEYYFYNMPDYLICTFSNIKRLCEYEIEVVANSFWHTTSAPLKTIVEREL